MRRDVSVGGWEVAQRGQYMAEIEPRRSNDYDSVFFNYYPELDEVVLDTAA
jgi:hypothetical protein